jgi:CelD/BcsL family acetyltransferase involved in cellulose biosynthesis
VTSDLQHETHKEIESLAAEWDELADRAGVHLFLRPGWLGPWWASFGSGPLEIFAARREGRLAGVLPLQRVRGALRSLTNWHTPAFGAVAEDAEALGALVRQAFAARPRSLHVGFVDPGEPFLAGLRAGAATAGYAVLERTVTRSPYLAIESDWESYERSLSKNVRNDVRRRLRRLEDEGSVSFEVHDGRERLEELLDEGFAVEAAGWKGSGGTAIASRENTRRFYAEVGRWAAGMGFLRLAYLRLDGRAIAFLYDFEETGVHYYQKGGYDPGLGRFSPSKVLLHLMVQRAFELGLERFEFLGGDEAYKLQWATATRDFALLQAFAGSLPGLAERAAYAHGRPLAKRLLGLAGR